jgi:GNAT superfamily N-acetyltransferase
MGIHVGHCSYDMDKMRPCPSLSVPPRVADAEAIGGVHVASWQWAYAGLMPTDVLAGLSVAGRTTSWRDRLSDPEAVRATFVAERDNRVVGFAAVGPGRDDVGGPSVGELYAVYVLAEVAGDGAGRALHDECLGWLANRHFPLARLWVLTTNVRAQAFYRRQGWSPDGQTKVHTMREGHTIHETRYSRSVMSQA